MVRIGLPMLYPPCTTDAETDQGKVAMGGTRSHDPGPHGDPLRIENCDAAVTLPEPAVGKVAPGDECHAEKGYEAFHARIERRLAIALATRYGPQVGREAALDALAWGWEHWERLRAMDNPAGYLYRVGQTRARRLRPLRPTRPHRVEDGASADEVAVEPGLDAALDCLSTRQRQVVVLTHGYGCTHREAAELLGLSRSTVQNHAERGLAKLRQQLEVHDA